MNTNSSMTEGGNLLDDKKVINLFCFSHAGGSTAIYSNWKKYMPSNIRICPIELTGRGRRFNEPFYHTIQEAAEDIFNRIKGKLDTYRYAFFGHSMGCLIIYELMKYIKKESHSYPEHLFLSGRYPPDIIKKDKYIHLMGNEELKKELIKMGGTPEEIINDADFFSVFVKILRADYKMLETYCYVKDGFIMDCDMTIMNGNDDQEIMHEDINSWIKFTHKTCAFRIYEGGHFYINNNVEAVIQEIAQTISSKV